MLEQGKHYDKRTSIVSNRGKKAMIDVCNFRKLGVPAGHYCYATARGKIGKGFVIPYAEFNNWKVTDND